MSTATLAIDFGTSNSAVAEYDGTGVRRLAIEDGSDTLPTAVFFPTGEAMRIGAAASKALIAGDDGRYMRALKSILGTSLFHESRLLGGTRRTLAEVVTAFLVAIKARAEARAGHSFSRVLSGRPVHFHSNDPARDARAETDLRDCFLAAGFTEVAFMYEPEAAALSSQGLGKPGETGIVVDIGGGTSDFSVFQTTPTGMTILASHGIRLGGTDFDQAVSMAHTMPLLGQGGELRRTFGAGLLPVPNAIYRELSAWAKIPFLYSRDTERAIDDMLKHAVTPNLIARLGTVIEHQLGHELAFAVEAGKIAANSDKRDAAIAMGYVERGLTAPISAASLHAAMDGFRERLREAMYATLFQAAVRPDQISAIVLVGGSSLMRMISDEAQTVCPGAEMRQSEAFTAVVDGLALATAKAG